jgi:hypothetical protein
MAVAILLVFLGAAVYLAYEGTLLAANFHMPAGGYLALGFGAVFSIALGVGLMALIFYSSR